MHEIRMVLSLGQRMVPLVTGAVLTVFGVVGLAVDIPPVGFGTGLVFVGIGLYSAKFAAVLTPHGIIVKGLTTQRFAWGEIAAVEARSMLGGRHVRLTLVTGRKVRMRVPISAPLQRDPEFDAKVATIWHWWQAGIATARQWHPQAPVPPQSGPWPQYLPQQPHA